MKVKIIIFVIISLNVLFAEAQQNFYKNFNALVSQPEYKNALVGIQIEDAATSEIIFGYNGDKLMIPASTLKIVTSAAALEILGADYRFKTKIGFSGKIMSNKLEGDLIIVGGGDPALGSEYFRNEYGNPHFMDVWVQKIKAAGIAEINGNLIIDGSLYDTEKIPPTWIWEDIGNYYGTGVSALTVYDNLFRISFSSSKQSGEPTKITSIHPDIQGLEIENNVLSSDINSDLAYVFGSVLDAKREITGTIPKNRKSFVIKAAVPKPEELLSKEFLSYLAKAGIVIKGEVKFKETNHDQFQVIYINESPTLAEIIKVLNHESVNLFAEHIVKQIAAEKTGIGNRKNGIEIIKDYFISKGIDSGFFMEDGSGLSHFNAISSAHITSILNYMFKTSENKNVFYASLASIGYGTLSNFRNINFPQESLKVKSGSMSRIRCFAGYLITDSGKTLSFSIMFNHFEGTASKLNSVIEKLWLDMKTSF
ncbi:MAG: D-alanyl-D-alanine carboxypeptidase/D-alanyl-D-alanine-endopeptidase [Bacteroidales bacterium]|jgi:D-alanyl-D-alanine carboxypeptidase/D-alanyl-D-alanine-endopeptidase (penicillin-binding protein 4)|nr:D-alanyl-D-alanine carboxypeptidase/D-alanyl-D-alanine-endopeptidase [Bacteroidales bacterium]